MTRFISWLKRIFILFVAAPATEPHTPEAAPEDAAPAEIPLVENRQTRRAKNARLKQYERARRRFDKWVEPQGTPPTPIERSPSEKSESTPPSLPAVEENDPTGWACVDIHHSDRKTDVLYDMEEFYGEFTFRDSVIDQLERYFVYLDRMKKHDPDGYHLYRQIGATLKPYISISDIHLDRETHYYEEHKTDGYKKIPKLSPWFLEHRPAFACIAYGANPEAERREVEDDERNPDKTTWTLIPRFFYFTKYAKPPPTVEAASGGDVYTMTVWWDRIHGSKRKHGSPTEFAIFVGTDGRMRALRCLETSKKKVRCKKNGAHTKRGTMFTVPQRAWHIPETYESWARTHNTDPQHLLTGLFEMLARDAEEAAHKMAKISVCDKGNYAVFSVPVERLPYFFRDRDYQLNEKGHRKRILHMVRPHVRKDGSTVGLRFRGAREFTWADYDVLITILGLDHRPIEEFSVGSVDEYWIEKGAKGYIDGKETGRKFRKYINTGRMK